MITIRNANGYGSVIKLSGNRRKPFAVRVTAGWTEDNKQIYKYLGYFAKRQEAVIALAEYNKSPYDLDARNITFKEVFEQWSTEKYPKISKGNQQAYTSCFYRSEELHNMKFRDIKKTHLQGVINRNRLTGKSLTMLPRIKQLFSQMTKYALENDIVDKDYTPFLDVDITSIPQPKQKSIFTSEQIQTLWDIVDIVDDVDIVLILIYTGFRISELCNITKEDIFLNERYIVGGLKTEAGKNRVVPISLKILPIIEKRLKNSKEGFLIYNKWGNKLNKDTFAKNYMKPLMAQLEMEDKTAHTCRHTFVSMLTAQNINPLIIKRIVGHSNRDVTEHYTHFTINQLIDAVDKI